MSENIDRKKYLKLWTEKTSQHLSETFLSGRTKCSMKKTSQYLYEFFS